MDPLFTVIITTYNRPNYLEAAISSVIQQTFESWELIIVDDGSERETRRVATSFEDKRIKYIYQENQQLSVARNTGIDNAQGMYICFLDDDDWFYQNHLWELKSEIERRDYPLAFFYTGAYNHFDSGKTEERKLPELPIENGIGHVLLNTILPSTSCLHQEILKKYKFKTEHLPAEDRALWVQVVAKYPLYQVSKYTVAYHRHEQQVTSNISDDLQWNVIERGISTMRNLLKSENIKKLVSQKIVKQYLSRTYYWYMLNAIENRNQKKSLLLLAKSIKEYPAMLLSKRSLAALRDIIFIKLNS